MEFSLSRSLAFIDWAIILAYLVLSLAIGIYFSRRGTKSISEYFASGRGASWWLLGTSMVATTFAADTPLAISGLVVKQGIWGNWFWWSQVPMFMLVVFFFSRLWRRAGILTDTELVQLRYSGKAAQFLRGFRALYFSLPYNALVMGWVILSMTKIMGLTLNVEKRLAVVICIAITLSYSAISGLWGVLATDFFQFWLAMGMAIFLAIYAVGHLGGMEALLAKMHAIYGAEKTGTMLSIVPSPSDASAFPVFLIYIGLLWWTVGNTDGGAYLAQRMIAAKDEKHSFFAFLWFDIAHFCLRPWPWIAVGMVAAVMFPGIVNPHTQQPDPEMGYIAVMLTLLKPGFLGLMLASFLAAFMSTIATQINWGASYLVNDFYKPFFKPEASERHYVAVSILATVLMAVLGGLIGLVLTDIFKAWLLLSAINAGIGIVYICRWYWWRINAWSEIAAISSILLTVAVLLIVKPGIQFPWTLLYTVPISLVVWLTATLLTRPTDEPHLVEFYRRVHPGGPGWKPIAAKFEDDDSTPTLFRWKNVIGTVLGVVAVYGTLIGIGKLILGDQLLALALLALTAVSVMVLARLLSKEKWGESKQAIAVSAGE